MELLGTSTLNYNFGKRIQKIEKSPVDFQDGYEQ